MLRNMTVMLCNINAIQYNVILCNAMLFFVMYISYPLFPFLGFGLSVEVKL